MRKSAAAVHFSPPSCPIAGAANAAKTVLAGANVRFRCPKSDRLLGSIVIGVLLLVVAVGVGVGVETKALLVGQSTEPALRREISCFLSERAEVAEVLNLITLQHGAYVVVAVKARMAEHVSALAMIAAINDCERALRAAFPQVQWIFFEPDSSA